MKSVTPKATPNKKAVAKKSLTAKAKTTPKKFGKRADLGAPIDGFFTKQQPHLRAILEELRKLVDEAAPDATSSIKWGMPFYTVGENMMCALAGHKAHVNLILAGAPGTFDDPDNLLEGDGKTGKHLKLRTLAELPRAAVRRWLRAAASRARQGVH